MSRLTRALFSAGIGAAIPTAVVAGVTLVTGTSFTRALVDHGDSRPRRRASRVASHIGWTAGATLLFGVLLAIATDAPTRELMTSRFFLIAAGIAVAVAGLEASSERKPI
jgi:hypothetical protein